MVDDGSVLGTSTGSSASPMRVIDTHVRAVVRIAITQQAIRGTGFADGIATLHDQLARCMHDISLEFGMEPMVAAAEYAAAALETGSIYPGDELEAFLRRIAASVRATSKQLSRSTPQRA